MTGVVISDVRDASGNWKKAVYTEDKVYLTRAFVRWQAMRYRCKPGPNQRRAYIGCTVSPEFQDFQYFTEWLNNQPGYGVRGYELDKDLLVPFNRVYSANTCVMIPKKLNMLVSKSSTNAGAWELRSGRFRAEISVDNINHHIGDFETREEAVAAYKVAKEAEAQRWYERAMRGDIKLDERVIERLRNWKWREI